MKSEERSMRAVDGRGRRKLAAVLAVLMFACAPAEDGAEGGVSISFEKYELSNGLDVILHVDRSDPIAAVSLGLLADMSAYGFPADYVLQREQIVRDMTIERVRELADRYLDPADMIWLVVGDARTQLHGLRALGLGEPTVLDRRRTSDRLMGAGGSPN